MDNRIDDCVNEIIVFLKKWGMWRDTAIMAGGNRYVHTDDVDKTYNGLSNVEVIYNVDPEEYTKGLVQINNEDGKTVWKSFSNPEHILDMVYVGPLYMLLRHGEYEVNPRDISDKAWEYIFENTDVLDEYLFDQYGCSSVEEFYFQTVEDKIENDDYTKWDPLVFDTWEDYQVFVNGESYEDFDEVCKPSNYERYGTYAEYIEDLEDMDNLTVADLVPLWDKMVRDAKESLIREAREKKDEIINIWGIVPYVKDDFFAIFEKYGLWYEFGFGWSLTCYRI